MINSEKPIWQPINLHEISCFNILLNPEFAKEMYETELTKEGEKIMQRIFFELLGEKRAKNLPSPAELFHKNRNNDSLTCLLSIIPVNHSEGIWLCLDNPRGEELDFAKPLEYFGHNFDHLLFNKENVYLIMSVFGLWVEYAECLKSN